eukprot:TRINITY_DN12291_c0_g1_i1.p1 TRINITY_DN12291_c0_g1~~TRINITY_DN12291_c0_g1_i1.p1  ORF type:complete len:421 (+),score=66.65 TRINITY_DN12291_c0_g1_i1:164-1426(+)
MKEYLWKYWKEIVSIVSIIVIVCIELAYRQPLYDHSLDVISDWQGKENDSLKDFFKLISFLGTDNVMAAVLILSYSFMPRRMIMKFVFCFYTIQNTLAFFKIFYHSPRPYFSSDEVAALNCTHGYGNPSGHCMFNTAFFGTIWVLVFVNNTDVKRPFFSKPWKRALVMWLTFFLIVCLMVLMFLSRVYLGAHALNQTLYGCTIGLWAVFTFGFVLPKYIDKHFDEFVKKGGVWTGANCGFITIVAIFVVLQVLGIVLYFCLRNHNSFMAESWVERLRVKCPKSFDEMTPFEDSFKLSVHSSLYFFFYLSQIINAKCFPKTMNFWYSNIGVKKLILRTLLVAVILICCVMANLFIDKPFALRIGFAVIACNFLAGFVGLPLIDWLAEKWGLISCYTGETSEEPSMDPKKESQKSAVVSYKA